VKCVLYFYISISRCLCAVPNMAAVCSSPIACFAAVLRRYCLSDSETVPVAPIITGITFTFTFHTHYTDTVRSLYFKIFSASLLITFLSPQITPSIHTHVPVSLPQTMLSGLLLGTVLSVCTCTCHNMITSPS